MSQHEREPGMAEVLLAIGRLEGKVESLQSMKTDHKALETRVTGLEKSRSWLVGAGFALGFFIPSILKKMGFNF